MSRCVKCGPKFSGPGDVAEREVIIARRTHCRPCSHRTNPGQPMTTIDRCQLCDCPISALTKSKTGVCLAGHW